MALIQKLSLRRKTAETPKTSDAPVAEETPVETPEVSETPQPAAQPAKRLITKKALAPEPDEDIIEAEVEPAPAPSKKLATSQPVIEADEDPDEAASETAVVSYRPMAMGQIDGAISERDLMRPRVNMVQSNSSDLESKGFTVGQIVVNGEVLVWDKGYDRQEIEEKLEQEKQRQQYGGHSHGHGRGGGYGGFPGHGGGGYW
jgi:hypothetical protein